MYANEQDDPMYRKEERPDHDERHYPSKAEIAARAKLGNEYWEDLKRGMK